MESHQKSATEWLQFCWDFVKPRWNSFATFFFSCLQQCKNFFSMSFVLHAIFFFLQALAGNFFSKSPTSPPQKVKWSAPKLNYISSLLLRPAGSRVFPLCMRNASRAFLMESRPVCSCLSGIRIRCLCFFWLIKARRLSVAGMDLEVREVFGGFDQNPY